MASGHARMLEQCADLTDAHINSAEDLTETELSGVASAVSGQGNQLNASSNSPFSRHGRRAERAAPWLAASQINEASTSGTGGAVGVTLGGFGTLIIFGT